MSHVEWQGFLDDLGLGQLRCLLVGDHLGVHGVDVTSQAFGGGYPLLPKRGEFVLEVVNQNAVDIF